MGNSESQYSLQGPRSNSFTLPNRQNHYSLKIRSAKEELSSHHGWWRTGSRGSGIKSKTLTRSCFSQPRTSQSPLMHHYDHVTDGREGTKGTSSRWSSSSRCLDPGGILPSENGHREGLGENGQHGFGRGDCNGHAVFGYRTPERKSRPEELEDHSSPRVLIKSDGSVRVEFSQVSKNSLLPDERGGPVQLLKFSPTSHSLPAPSAAPHGSDREATPEAAKPVSRTSKGSSLSSEGSWYDSPWGTGGELNDDHTALHNGVSQTFPSAQTELFDQQQHGIGITELYRDTSMAATFPSAKDLKLAHEIPFKHRSSFVCVMEEPDVQEFHGVQEYSSFTLPCRKAQAGADDAEKKESVRNRMRRLSDWTGSLTRRKKKSKEPRYKEPIDCFDSGVDGLTADTSSPSQVSSLRGYPKGQSRARSQSQVLPPSSGSVGALHPATDALRQNIYDNFMRELEASQTAAGSGEERGENSAEETESSSQETVGSLEQLDLLFEKEQGVVRRAGWLTFKPLLTVHKDRKLELVARRKWKQYWVTLKGCTLLFYETYGKGSPEQESLPSYALLAEDGIVQAVPEHPKKENVFCLSNAYGDVYLFQATSQTDLENWVTAVHSASASLFAKRHGKEDTLLLLRGQIHSVLQKIDMDGKMKKMAELQLSIVSDSRNRKAIENQIQQWDQNLERFNIDLFRMRCYLASLQGGELPNPKSLLATASRPSKAALGRLGIFSVSSFHALICSRDEATLRKRSLSLSQRSRGRKGVFSSLKGLDKRSRDKRPSASQIFDSAEAEQLSYLPPCSRERLDVLDGYSVAPSEGNCWDRDVGTPTCVYMPDYQAVTVALKSQHTVTDVLKMACKVKNLDPNLHCLRLRKCADDRVEVWTPAAHELVQDLPHDELEVGALTVCTLHMTRPTSTGDFGFAVTGHVDTLRRSRIFVTEVLPDGIAFSEGLRPSDEILVLNGCEVSSLDLALIQTLFSEHMLRLTVRREPPSCRQAAGLPRAHSRQQVLKDYLYRRHRAKSATDVSSVADSSAPAELEHHLQLPLNHRAVQHSKRVCPRSQSAAAQRQTCSRSRTNSNTDVNGAGSVPMAEKMEHNARSCIYLTALIELFLRDRLPAEVLFSFVAMCWFWPDFVKKHNGVFLSSALLVILRMLQDKLSRLLEDVAACMACHSTAQSVETVCTLYHSFQETSGGLMEAHKETDGTLLRPCPRHMSATERLRKVIQELVDTEKSYVKDLSCLFEIYLKPLQKETFLTLDEMESLFGSLPEMLDFQKVFLQTLEERISSSPDFNTLETPVQFKKLLFSLGGSFLYYADHFKLYSGFCANHIKVQKVLERAKTDRAFKEFLDARNPTKQHSSTLESYLIKPVQRVLKYPLLLRELVSLTDTDSEEHYHLSEALKAMEKVASHINEMQKIYEDYGAVFDHLVAEHCGPEKEVTEISMGEFLMHSSVIWLNPFASLGRMKKEPELTVFVFKKAVILVYRENKQAKKKMNIPRSAHSHGDQDLFKFRWLIPLSALQVRLGNTAETNCVWELIHTKSEVEGRPETVFQLCSSTPECKVNTVRVIRSVLRENVRKGMRGTDHTAEKTCKAQLAPTRTPLPSSAKIGSSRASRLWQEPVDDLAKGFSLKPPHADSDGASESSGTPSLTLPSETPPSTNPALRDGVTKESDILGDEDDGFSERLARRDSAPGYIDAQFSELRLEPEGREVDSPEGPSPLRRAHFCPIKRRERGEPSFSRSQGASWSLRQSESTACSVDLNSLLEREFSVQSLASVVNEDCFFDNSVVAARADLEGGEFTLNALP